jgi:hypothetical protein
MKNISPSPISKNESYDSKKPATSKDHQPSESLDEDQAGQSSEHLTMEKVKEEF